MTSKLPQRKIGDALVSAIGLGCMSLAIPPINDDESLALLTAAADLGINFWITSDAYGDNELLLGRETGRRDEIFLATKFRAPASEDDEREACDGSRWEQGICQSRMYQVSRTSRHGSNRSVLAAPRRPQHAGRGDGRFDG